ncbi:MAG: hypothetical protein RI964_1699 [Pseudomonadota bacterium]|jgi:uncharacterized protein YdgA (DUF945 family)
MKKLITFLSVPVVLAAAWGGTSWYVGQQTETTLKQLIEQQNQSSSAGVKQELVSYEKSAFGAKAITKLTFEMPPLKEMIGEVQFINDIKNGPIFANGVGMARVKTTLDMESLSADKRQPLTTAFDGKPPFEANTLIGFGGGTSYDVTVNPAKFAQDGSSVTFDGAQLTGDATAEMLGKFTLHMGKVEGKEANSQFTVPSADMNGNITGLVAGQALGTFDVKVPQVSVLAEGTTEPFIFDLNVKTASDIKNNELEGNVIVQMDNIKGVKDALSKVQYTVDVKGMNADGLKEIGTLQADMQNAVDQMTWNADAMETLEGQKKQQELMDKISKTGEQMLNTVFSKVLKTDKSQMHLNFAAESAKGKANADVNLVYAGTGTPDMMQLATYGANDWAKMVKGKLLLDIDKGILPEGAEMMVTPVVQQGFLVQDGDKFKGELNLAGETVTLNGKQMPFTDLLQQFLPGMGAANAGNATLSPKAGSDLGIPDDLMQKMQKEGMTPEVMQMLEESDDVSPETLKMLKELQQMQPDVQAGKLPEDVAPAAGDAGKK